MNLKDIGFYTLSDERAKNSSATSPLHRCEMLLTDRCNFRCPYCRGLQRSADLPFNEATRILDWWLSEGLKNVRFSGGEPTLYAKLTKLVGMARKGNIEHVAISTNGSNKLHLYKQLIDAGANDFSISLDACCSSTGDKMAGHKGAWEQVVRNIEAISRISYVTVGIVLNEDNEAEAGRTIRLAHELGVNDIRVIPSAQHNGHLRLNLPRKILEAHPILKYRLTNSRHVRGLHRRDSRKCRLALDDMAVWNGHHYPCIIYLREAGKPIGPISKSTRRERFRWHKTHDSHKDPICRRNCLDVCVAYNNKAEKYAKTHAGPATATASERQKHPASA